MFVTLTSFNDSYQIMNNNMNNPVYLIDNRNTFFRMYYGMPELKDSNGNPTQALYGYAKLINNLYNHSQENYGLEPIIIICDDSKEPTYRKEKFEQYKENRAKEERPQDFYDQIKLVEEYLLTSKIITLDYPKYEADDIIATIAKKTAEMKIDTYIISSDKDLSQLIWNHVFIMDGIKRITWSKNNIFDRFNVPSDKIVDYLSLIWDKSDNIPWVDGIWKISAVKTINSLWSIEDIYKVIDNEDKLIDIIDKKILTKSLVKKLIDWREMAFFSKELILLTDDLNIDISQDKLEKFILKRGNINRDFLLKHDIKSV